MSHAGTTLPCPPPRLQLPFALVDDCVSDCVEDPPPAIPAMANMYRLPSIPSAVQHGPVRIVALQQGAVAALQQVPERAAAVEVPCI